MSFALPLLASPAAANAAEASSRASSGSTAPRLRKLEDAAQQFEGMLLQELLKPMQEHSFGSSDADGPSEDPDSSGFADTLSSFGSETLATAIARSGGLGIAKLVVHQVEGERQAHSLSAHKP